MKSLSAFAAIERSYPSRLCGRYKYKVSLCLWNYHRTAPRIAIQKRKVKPEPNSPGIFLLWKLDDSISNDEDKDGFMKDTRLLKIFNDTKDVLCKYDYYIHTAKRILHLTNTELKIPHLMGLQYVGRPNQYAGDFGVYAVKKGRITLESLEKLVKKYYKTKEKQDRMLKLIHLKLDYLYLLPEMFYSYSKLYLFDINHNPDSEFDSDYLLIHRMEDKVLHLGIVKAQGKEKGLCHCNSFITTYVAERDYDILYRDLSHSYEITKIVREDKITKQAEVIYQSEQVALREKSGIEKMLYAVGIEPEEKLVRYIMKLNVKFGEYHTLDMLSDTEQLMKKCRDKRDEALVKDFISLWRKCTDAYKQELWDEAKRKCRLGEEEIRMAKEMGLNPQSLIRNIPNKKEMWKAPVKDWIHDMYEKRQRKSEQKAKRKRENKQ